MADLRGTNFIVLDFDTYKASLGEAGYALESVYFKLINYITTLADETCTIFAVKSPSGGLHI